VSRSQRLDRIFGFLQTRAGLFSKQLDGCNFLAGHQEFENLLFEVIRKGVTFRRARAALQSLDGVLGLGESKACFFAEDPDGFDLLALRQKQTNPARQRIGIRLDCFISSAEPGAAVRAALGVLGDWLLAMGA
jgi:hypothetical protein